MAFKIAQLSLNLPFGIGGMTVKVTQAQQKAAWSLYVEYATRIATQPLAPEQGSIKEALSSIHSLFRVTRETLKSTGPEAAEGPDSVGPLAIRILNDGVRPFLLDWHTRFQAFENQQRNRQQQEHPGRESVIDETQWPERDTFYPSLETFRLELRTYVDALGKIAGVTEA